MKDKINVIFMGTPEFSLNVLDMLIKNTNVIAVVTQPDKIVGKNKEKSFTPVKKLAMENNILVLQPEKIRKEYDEVINLKPDLIVTCAYGQIIPEELIYAPLYNTINVHASLLPKYRGGAPIHHAIINGEKEVGITIMYTDKGMDSGDIIKSKSFNVDVNDTYDVVSKKMSSLGAELLLDVLPSIFDGTCKREKQDDALVTFAPVIKREDEYINFNNEAFVIHNKIRGLSSIPGAYAILNDLNIKIYLSSLE
jgi:methionyl-tRNA formyltransferase